MTRYRRHLHFGGPGHHFVSWLRFIHLAKVYWTSDLCQALSKLWWHTLWKECTCIHDGKTLLGNRETKQIITKIIITVTISSTKENYCKQQKLTNVSENVCLKKWLSGRSLKDELELPKRCWWFQLSRTEKSCGDWTLAHEAGWYEMRQEQITVVNYC